MDALLLCLMGELDGLMSLLVGVIVTCGGSTVGIMFDGLTVGVISNLM